MKRVYLDQNHWISLARAGRDHPAGKAYEEVLTVVCKAVDLGLASFPLSSQHYYETHKQPDRRRRHDLAATMASISRYDAIAGLQDLVPGEIDGALRQRFGRPVEVRASPPFGKYLEHAFGQPPIELRLPANLTENVKVGIYQALQLAMLGGDVRGLGFNPPDIAVDGLEIYNRVFKESRTRLTDKFVSERVPTAQQVRTVAAGALWDIIEPLKDALARAGVSWEEFALLGEAGWIDFIHDVPTRDVDFELLRLRHQNPQKAWDANDLADVTALAVAVVYCDVVVTENLWADLLKRAKLGGKYNTLILSDLKDLVPLLGDGVAP